MGKLYYEYMLHNECFKSVYLGWIYPLKVPGLCKLSGPLGQVVLGKYDLEFEIVVLRETVPLQNSDMGKKKVSVLAHSFLLP